MKFRYTFSDGSVIYDDIYGTMADKHMLYNPQITCVKVERKVRGKWI